MPLELMIQGPDGLPRRIELDRERFTLGRAHNNDLAFADDASLSRKHLTIERRDGQWWVRDLKSKNGTLLNGARIDRDHPLQPRDRVNAGQLTLMLIDPVEGPPDDRVVFVQEPGADPHPSATVMTSLDGLLSGEATEPGSRSAPPAPHAPRQSFQSPVVRALIRAGRELAHHRPLDELFKLILDLSIEAVSAERGVLMTLDGAHLVPRAVHGEGFRISTTVRDRVVREKTSLLVRDTAQEEALRGQKSIYQQKIQSLIAVPLQTDNRVIGLIYVDASSLGRSFDPDDLNLLTVLANVAAIRIEHELYLELRRQEERHTRDLEQAAEIQRAILPKGSPRIPGLDVAGYNRACRTVGGDYYDFISCQDGRLAVLLGDVAGKGMSAAILMSNLQARVQLLCEESAAPAALMRRLDASLSVNCPPNRFITLFACLIDDRDGSVTYSNAGHNPPLIVRCSGEVEELTVMGTMLGILPELGYEQQTTVLEPGDVLVIFSDGVTEATDAAEEEFGEKRLAELVAGLRDQPAATIVERVNDELREFTGGLPAADDVTLVVVRRLERTA